MISCPHGGGPVHLLVDLWWVFALCVPGIIPILKWFGVKVRECFCCQHEEDMEDVGGSQTCGFKELNEFKIEPDMPTDADMKPDFHYHFPERAGDE